MRTSTYSRNDLSARATRDRGVRRLLAAVSLAFLLAAPGAAAGELELEPGEFDPTAWNDLLARFVTEEGVDYAAWKAHGTAELDAFLAAAGEYDLTSVLGKEPRVAFLTNAYNAWAVRQILEHYPVASVKEIPGFFDEKAVRIAGEDRTLASIEAAVAATMPHAPQVIFGLAPGARGLPPLAVTAYTSGNHVRLCGANGHKAMTVAHPVLFDKEKGVIYIGPLLERHREHIESLPGGMPRFLADYLSLQQMMALTGIEPEYVVEEPDWSLNDASPRGDAGAK